MKTTRRILSMVLALMMILSLSLTAFALDGNEVYLSPAPGTSYTTITSANSVTLGVYFSASNGNSWYNTGFDSAAQAANVVWTVTSDPDDIIVNNAVVKGSGSAGTLTTATGTVSVNTANTGVAIINASYTKSNPDGDDETFTLDLTVAVDANSAQNEVAANIYVINTTSTDHKYIANGVPVTVAPASEVSGSIIAGMSGAYQNIPTAMSALDALYNNVDEDESPISSITLSDTGEYVTELNGLYYWSYAVYDAQGNLVNVSQNISASICEIANGSAVVWKYGAYSFASTLNSEKGTW